MPNPKQILSDKFDWQDRGPSIIKIIWKGEENVQIEKIIIDVNFVIKFIGLQTIMITPHEVYNGELYGGGIYDLGHSDWFKSMNPNHLAHCSHYRLFFYDEIIDVICENITIDSPEYFKPSKVQ